jgi:hypothetical protein
LDEKIDPSGWDEWHAGETHRLETAFYAEYGSTGAGGNMAKRDSHSRQLNDAEVKKYLAANFLAGSDGWNPEFNR